MYFTKKSEVAVLLAILLVLLSSTFLFVKGAGITGAAVIEPEGVETQDLGIQGDTTIDTCQDLNVTGELYRLTQSVSSGGTCFSIRNNSITLDCSRFHVLYDLGGGAVFGINNSGGYDNIT